MNLKLSPQNPLEWLALQTGLIPNPILLAHFGFITSKIIGEAAASGVLEVMAAKPQTPLAIAAHCGLNEKAVTALLDALVGLQLVRYSGGQYRLAPASKRWLLKDAPHSYRSQLLFDQQVCYSWLNQTGHFLQTGQGLQYHDTLTAPEWSLYQDAMEATSHHISRLAAGKIKVPATAAHLLDIGGAHGLYSAALLKKHPQLKAEVYDLPKAVMANSSKPNNYPGRLQFTQGNILKDDLPTGTYDIIIMANVAHHFTEAENRLVAQKVFSALRTGGVFYILEFFKKGAAKAAGDAIGAVQSFFFAFSSTSGLWEAPDIVNWLATTGFLQVRVQPFAQFPGFGMVSGKKG
jgi:SAM-dependent methyltransferase